MFFNMNPKAEILYKPYGMDQGYTSSGEEKRNMGVKYKSYIYRREL